MFLLLNALAGLALAVANGANDNGKPVATLVGSGVLSARRGLAWGFWTTLAGSLFALVWGAALVKTFSGQGLVAQEALAHPAFLPSVALAAAATVALATRFSLPVSTTHALLGGLLGAGLVLGHGQVAWMSLGGKLAGPLLLSPLLAMAAAWMLAPILPPRSTALRALHVISSGAVSFARGLNDAPKIAAVLLPPAFLGRGGAVAAVALAMGFGGWFLARGVTATLSREIANLEDREPEALAGNLATALLALLASRWGLPVSSTHVATGALVGAGASRGEFRTRVLARILLAWGTTLPLAALIGAGLARLAGGLP